MVQPIPESWKQAVIKILKTQDRRLIEWTLRARQDWQNFGWEYEAYEAISNALADDELTGNKVGMLGATESYEFLFMFNRTKMYAKVGLKDGNLRIVVFSAHRAQRPTL